MNQLYQLYENRLYSKCEALVNQQLQASPENLELLTLKSHLMFHHYYPPWNSTSDALLPSDAPSFVWSFAFTLVEKMISHKYAPKESPSAEDKQWIRMVCTLMKALGAYEQCLKFLTVQLERFKICDEEMWKYALFSVSRVNGSFDLQATWAMKMFQMFKSQNYMRWSYLSSLMSPDEKRRSLALLLSHKALLNEKQAFHDEFLRFMIITLKKEQRWSDVVALLLDKRSSSIDHFPIDRKSFLADALKNNGQYVEAIGLYSFLLKGQRDEWTWWTGIFDSVKLLQDSKCEIPSTETIALTYDTVGTTSSTLELPNIASSPLTFIKSMQSQELEENQGDRVRRGPFLAELEYLSRFGSTSDLENACESYFIRFNMKPTCFADLKKFLSMSLSERITKSFENASHKNELDRLKGLISLRRIEYFLKHCPKGLESQIATLVQEYHSALPLGSNLEATENQHGDELLLLAVYHILDDISLDDSSLSDDAHERVLRSIYLLEYGLERSKYNYQFKILLVRLYSKLRLFNRAVAIFESMDIKNILWESVSYIILYDMYAAGVTHVYPFMMKGILKYRIQHEKETPDLLLLAYRNETYSKVDEFIEFQRRLDTSTTTNLFAAIAHMNEVGPFSSCERMYEYLQLYVKSLDTIDGFFHNPTNNDDYSVLVDFRSQDSSFGHSILNHKFSNKTIPIHAFTYYHALSLIYSFSFLGVNASNRSMRGKVEKQMAKKNDKQVKKLAASISHIPSMQELAEMDEKSKKLIEEVSSHYSQAITQANDFNNDLFSPVWRAYDVLFSLSNAVAGQKTEDIATLQTRFVEQLKLVAESTQDAYIGVYYLLVHIATSLFKLWIPFGIKWSETLDVASLFQTLVTVKETSVEEYTFIREDDALFDPNIASHVKSVLQSHDEQKQLETKIGTLLIEIRKLEGKS